jgi:DNA repair ATPase RecN
MFIKQLTQIERRQIRLQRLKRKYSLSPNFTKDQVEKSAEEHHHIGKSESHYEDIGSFLRLHAGDPAAKVFPLDLS